MAPELVVRGGEALELHDVDELLVGSDSEDIEGAPFIFPRRFIHKRGVNYRGITQKAFEKQVQKYWSFYFYNNPLPSAPIKGDYHSFKESYTQLKCAHNHAFMIFQQQIKIVQSNYHEAEQVLRMREKRCFPDLSPLYNIKD